MAPLPPAQPSDQPATKDGWRRRALDRRRSRSPDEIAEARAAVTDHLLRWPPLAATGTVCSYLPLRTEPLSVEFSAALYRQGCRVLVPVTQVGGPLQWAEYRPDLQTSIGVGRVPDPGPALPYAEQQQALQQVSSVLVPALLVARDGTRLGRGGGHYDRSFALTALGSAAERTAVVFDDEIVDALPGDPHDVPVTAVVSPLAGVRTMPLR